MIGVAQGDEAEVMPRFLASSCGGPEKIGYGATIDLLCLKRAFFVLGKRL